MQKLIVIVGPTASGKSALAVSLAKKFKGEVISADSRQVYRGLEIGSGAVTEKEAGGVRHHLIGVASPRRVFNAAHFVAAAKSAITDITRRGKVPIVAGGTAFWINAFVHGATLPDIKPDPALRRRLEKKSAAYLFAMLTRIDPRRAAGIEQKNPRRLIRAIEVARSLGRVPHFVKHSVFNTLWLGINLPPTILARRIAARAEHMIQGGLVAETRALVRRGIPKKRIREFGFEYRAALLYSRGMITRKAFAARLVSDTLHYAQQQGRWWKRNPAIVWLKRPGDAARLVRIFLRKNSSRATTTWPARARRMETSRARPQRLLRRDS